MEEMDRNRMVQGTQVCMGNIYYIYTVYSAIRRASNHAYGCVIKLKRCAWNQFHIRRNSNRSLTG